MKIQPSVSKWRGRRRAWVFKGGEKKASTDQRELSGDKLEGKESEERQKALWGERLGGRDISTWTTAITCSLSTPVSYLTAVEVEFSPWDKLEKVRHPLLPCFSIMKFLSVSSLDNELPYLCKSLHCMTVMLSKSIGPKRKVTFGISSIWGHWSKLLTRDI